MVTADNASLLILLALSALSILLEGNVCASTAGALIKAVKHSVDSAIRLLVCDKEIQLSDLEWTLKWRNNDINTITIPLKNNQ